MSSNNPTVIKNPDSIVIAYAKPCGKTRERIWADGVVIKDRSTANLWIYMFKITFVSDRKTEYFVAKDVSTFISTLYQKIRKSEIKEIDWTHIERDQEIIKTFNTVVGVDSTWTPVSESKPKVGVKIELKCELGDDVWVQPGFFLGTTFNNEISGPKKVIGWREIDSV